MKLAIMQPYFFPYIGYFQLIAAVDQFVVYDNIKYTKKGWINRNRMLQNGTDALFSLPLKSDSDTLHVCARELSANFNRDKLLNQFTGAYRHAPYFEQTFALIEQIVRYEDPNLFRYLHHSIVRVCAHLGLSTDIRISSEIDIDHNLKGQDKVLALCQALGAQTYINAIGGMALYDREVFKTQGVTLKFVRSRSFEYPQFGTHFVPWLSMVDVMMFNAPEQVSTIVRGCYELV
ncbi:WbqC family protein [Pseudomonas sp. S1Bt23]|uniref:WbqC family protein n=1 Tax=Pseudomonas sp. S1Bt23 TaxID=3095074 RepID=UPI002A5A201F|nr:WbqC family protein [Pseudomonas sp. S1Bt23]WPO46846.1 WbqC family protein [Pseudomonas sp. S1Bt23]